MASGGAGMTRSTVTTSPFMEASPVRVSSRARPYVGSGLPITRVSPSAVRSDAGANEHLGRDPELPPGRVLDAVRGRVRARVRDEPVLESLHRALLGRGRPRGRHRLAARERPRTVHGTGFERLEVAGDRVRGPAPAP